MECNNLQDRKAKSKEIAQKVEVQRSKNNAVLDFIVKILPQKQLLDYAEAVQNGVTTGYSGSLAYVLAFTVVLFALSWVFLQRTVHPKG